MPRRKTHAEHVAEIAAKNPNVEIIGQITGATDKVLTRCLICGYEWMALPSTLKQGHGCPKCSGRVVTHDEHMAAIIKANPNVEVLEKITNVNKKVLCRCKICSHEWRATPDNLKHGYGCPECGKIKRANAKRKTHDKHVADIKKVNPNIEILEEIKSATQKVLCRCLVCSHEWRAAPDKLKNNRGCPECAKAKIAEARKLTHDEQVEAIRKVNPNVKILGRIISAKKKVLCLCLMCDHRWETTPDSLKHGCGCPRCAKYGFNRHNTGKLYIMVDDLNVPTMMKIGVSVREDERSKRVLRSAHKAGVFIPALYTAKTWEGPTELMQRIEQMMHENYEEWNIKFPTKFDGYKEFFYYTPETAEAFDVIEETIHEIINGNQAA